MRYLASLFLVFAFVPQASAVPLASTEAAELDILFHADLMGRFAAPRCDGSKQPAADFGNLVAAMERTGSDAAPALRLLGGNTIAPGLFARGVLAKDKQQGAEALARMLEMAHYNAVAIGHHDLGLERARLVYFSQALQKHHIPLLATNLRCQGQPLCQLFNTHVLLSHQGQRVAVLSTLSASTLNTLAPELRAGLQVISPFEAITTELARLQRLGDVKSVILMTQMPGGKAARDELETLQAMLGRTNMKALPVRVILAAGLRAEGESGVLRVVQQDQSPTIVGSTADTTSVAHVRVFPQDQVLVDTLPAQTSKTDAATANLLTPYIQRYCEWYGDKLAPAPIDGVLTRDDFLKYVLAIMRKQGNAEIAFLNRGFVKGDAFPMRGTLRRADLFAAVPYQATLGVVRVQGADLEKLLGPSLSDQRLMRLGIERQPVGLMINGRPIDKARRYRIATIEFLAGGGDGFFAPGSLRFEPVPGVADLRSQIEAFLRSQTAVEDNDPDVDVQHDFGRPAAERPLWVWLSDLTFDVTTTSIVGTRATMPSEGYDAPQLTRAEQRSGRAQFTNIVQLRSLRHEADVRLFGAYGYARNQPQGGKAQGAETTDLIQASMLYSYRGLRDLSLPVPRHAVPDPYVRGLLESEFTHPIERTYRHAELTNTVGAQFTLQPKLRVRGGPGLRKQLLAHDDTFGRTRPLIEAGLILDPIAIPLATGLAARLEGWVDYVFVDPFERSLHQLKAQSRLSIPLVPTLFLTVGADVYATRANSKGWATATDGLVGLRVHFDAAHQRL